MTKPFFKEVPYYTQNGVNGTFWGPNCHFWMFLFIFSLHFSENAPDDNQLALFWSVCFKEKSYYASNGVTDAQNHYFWTILRIFSLVIIWNCTLQLALKSGGKWLFWYFVENSCYGQNGQNRSFRALNQHFLMFP